MSAQDDAFVASVKAIRAKHISMQEYDRQMIAALNERRTAIESTTLMGLSVSDDVAGCTGKPLEDLRRRAHLEMLNIRSYLNDFSRAVKSDPSDVYIDQSLAKY